MRNMNFTPTETLPQRAEAIARLAHAGQKRKYDEADQDYIVHPIRVAERARAFGLSSWDIAACYLHDVIEDCDPLYKNDIADHCGADVFALVHELTNPSKGLSSKRELRKEIDRAHLKNVSLQAICIKLLDRTDNLLHMKQATDDFKRLYLAESEALFEILKTRARPEGRYIAEELITGYYVAMKTIQGTLK